MRRRITAIVVLLAAVGCKYQGTSTDLWGGRLEHFVPTVEDHIAKAPIGPEEDVKRIEIHRDAIYSITVIQVNPGREVKLHCHAEHEEGVRVVRGNGMMLIEGRATAVGPGAFFVIRAGQDHGFKNSGTGVCVVVSGFEPPFDGKDRIER